MILADPQTSGGLLVAVSPDKTDNYKKLMQEAGFDHFTMMEIGEMTPPGDFLINVKVGS